MTKCQESLHFATRISHAEMSDGEETTLLVPTEKGTQLPLGELNAETEVAESAPAGCGDRWSRPSAGTLRRGDSQSNYEVVGTIQHRPA